MPLAPRKIRAREDSRGLTTAKSAIVDILHDLNREKEKLEEAEAKNEALLASLGDGIIASNEYGKITKVNAAAEHILGVSASELIGQWMIKGVRMFDSEGGMIPPHDRPSVEAVTRGTKVTTTVYFERYDGTKFPAALTVSPILLGGRPQGTIQVFRDITRETQVDRAKSEFVSLASHQLRTPLTSINWYTEMLLAGDAGRVSKRQRTYLEEIYEGNQRMIILINELLDASRIELGTFVIQPKPLRIVTVAQEVIKELKPTILEKRLKLKTTFDKNIPPIEMDMKLVRIIFQNLLSNAIKYTPAQGTVSLSMQHRRGRISILVTDTGYGIPDYARSKIFTKFFRADNVQEREPSGTGLGLYLVKSVVDLIRGEIWFKSTLGKGTTFYISFPFKKVRRRKRH